MYEGGSLSKLSSHKVWALDSFAPVTVWVEILSEDSQSLLFGLNYFSRFVHPSAIEKYFNILILVIDPLRYDVTTNDFNIAGLLWRDRIFVTGCDNYVKGQSRLI